MDLTEKTLNETLIYDGKIASYYVQDVLLPNGEKSIREIIRHDEAVGVIPFTEDGKVVFVKQFRKPIDRVLIEIPAGLVEKNEMDPLAAAKRELKEETGYTGSNWSEVTGFYSSPGFTDEYLTIFTTTVLSEKKVALNLDNHEFLEVVELTFEEAWANYEAKEIADAKTVFALHYWKQKRLEQKG